MYDINCHDMYIPIRKIQTYTTYISNVLFSVWIPDYLYRMWNPVLNKKTRSKGIWLKNLNLSMVNTLKIYKPPNNRSRMNIKNHRSKNGRRRNVLRVHTNMGGRSRLLRDCLHLFRRRAWPPPCRKGYIFLFI